MTLEEATQGLKAMFEGKDSGLGRTLKLDFGSDGCVFVDAASAPNSVSNDDGDADTVIAISLDNFSRLQRGDLDPTQAFMSGDLQVDGDLSGAMAFGNYTASQR
jgi:putative sterol carrier protein